jgi:hypothetical protein
MHAMAFHIANCQIINRLKPMPAAAADRPGLTQVEAAWQGGSVKGDANACIPNAYDMLVLEVHSAAGHMRLHPCECGDGHVPNHHPVRL